MLTLRDSIMRRLELLQAHEGNPELQAITKERVRRDPVLLFNDWGWTYDPRRTPAWMPFDLFDRQVEFIRFLEERERLVQDMIGEKSRDVGFTWLLGGYFVHRWLFKDGFKGGIGSRKLDYVDMADNLDAIFPKLRKFMERLPAWLMPAGYGPNCDTYARIINPENGAALTGEGGDSIGRGGRSTIYWIDESSFLEHPKLIDASLSANTSMRFDIGTPNGIGTPFYEKRVGGHTPVFTMHWKQDPRKNHWEVLDEVGDVIMYGNGMGPEPGSIPTGAILQWPWYEAEKLRLKDPAIIAQELDIDYTASLPDMLIPGRWIEACINLHRRINMGNPGAITAGLDVADGGNALTVLTIRQGNIVRWIYDNPEAGTTDTADWAHDLCVKHGVQRLSYDMVGVGAGVAGAFKRRAREGRLRIRVVGINAGSTPDPMRKWPDGQSSEEKFTNRKAELWWMLRDACEKTYEYIHLGVPHPIDELISLPDLPALKSQMSNIRYFYVGERKIRIETKEELQKRNVASPDYAESLVLASARPRLKRSKNVAGGERNLGMEVSAFGDLVFDPRAAAQPISRAPSGNRKSVRLVESGIRQPFVPR